ncbi:uncharacterized protein V6R79_025548 [Siganus canaliculatus]
MAAPVNKPAMLAVMASADSEVRAAIWTIGCRRCCFHDVNSRIAESEDDDEPKTRSCGGRQFKQSDAVPEFSGSVLVTITHCFLPVVFLYLQPSSSGTQITPP